MTSKPRKKPSCRPSTNSERAFHPLLNFGLGHVESGWNWICDPWPEINWYQGGANMVGVSEDASVSRRYSEYVTRNWAKDIITQYGGPDGFQPLPYVT